MLIMLALTLGTVGGIAVLITPRAVAATPVGWLTTSGAQIQTSAGKPYRIAGLSWFGMESGRCSPEGLDTISLDAGMTKIASFGFNTLRLPFSNQCLAATTAGSVNGIDFGKNPGLANRTPLQVMDAVIASAGSHGLSVILDDHRLDSGYQSETWYSDAYPETRWISDWQSLATRYADNTAVIGVDLFNEPNGRSCWGCGGANDWAAAATRAGNAILARNSHLLILVEGIERQGNGQNTWWGGGLADAAQRPISLSVAHRLVYAPHDYPATVWPQSWFSASNYPANLPAVWDGNWGYLAKQNQAPIVVGEFGTRYQSQSDQQWLNTLVSYIRANNLGFMYWSFNPTSSDTGGLVGDDWVTPQQAKLNALAPILPGQAGSTTGPGAPATSATPKPTSTPTPTSTTKPTPTPTVSPTSSATLTGRYYVKSSWDSGYVAEVTMTATGGARHGWTMSWADPLATRVVSTWGMNCALSSGRFTCTSADWGSDIAAGQSLTVGLQVDSPGPAPANPALTIK